jgi:hypothetical protein
MQVLTRWLWAGWGRALQRRRGTWRRSPPAHQAHQGVGSRQMAAGQHARLGSSRVCAVAAAAHQLLPGAALHAGLRKRVAELIKLGEKRAKNGAPPQMRTQRAVQPRPHIGPPRKPFAARTGGGVAAGRVARPSAHQCTGSRTRAHTPCPPPPPRPPHPTPPRLAAITCRLGGARRVHPHHPGQETRLQRAARPTPAPLHAGPAAHDGLAPGRAAGALRGAAQSASQAGRAQGCSRLRAGLVPWPRAAGSWGTLAACIVPPCAGQSPACL